MLFISYTDINKTLLCIIFHIFLNFVELITEYPIKSLE